MALLKHNGEYIRLVQDGLVEVYNSDLDRVKLKTATSYETILEAFEQLSKEKTEELINLGCQLGFDKAETFQEQMELIASNFDTFKLQQEVLALDREYAKYKTLVSLKKGNPNNEKFSIMEKYFPDIYDSIPNFKTVYKTY
jgi:hypothetical protein